MPNWVFNNLFIEGVSKDIAAIKNQLNTPFERTYNNYWDRETGSYIRKTIKYTNPVFAFWNIHKPTDLEAYESNEDTDKTNSLAGNDWYAFNNRNWGTKWDVAVSDEDKYPETQLVEENKVSLAYRFNTAWSPPVQAITHLAIQYPDVTFTLSYEEETGWGGEIEFADGNINELQDYENKCRDCDAINTMEYCENDCGEICNDCNYMAEADLEAVAECDTHKVFLDDEHVPGYRRVEA